MLDKKAYERLSRWIVSGLPTHIIPNATKTFSMKLLQRLSSSLLSAEYPSAADTPPDLPVFRRKVELSFNVLKELEKDINSAPTSGNMFPVSRRKGKQVPKNRCFNPLSFNSMEIAVPTTDVEVHDVYVGILSQLQSILEVRRFVFSGLHRTKQPQYYLLVLREPLVSEIFRSSYNKANPSSGRVSSSTAKNVGLEPGQSWSSVFPTPQQMKAMLHFDNVEGFGEWLILLSTQAQHDLRDYRRANGAMFRIVVKTIKWGLTPHRFNCC